MRVTLTSLLFILLFLLPVYNINATIIPEDANSSVSSNNTEPGSLQRFSKLKINEIEKLLGRKLKFKEKIAIKIYQWKIEKERAVNKEGSTKGKIAMIIGIIGVCCLILPFVNIAALPLAVLALILGYAARRKNYDDKSAKSAIVVGWVTIGLIVFAAALLFAIWQIG